MPQPLSEIQDPLTQGGLLVLEVLNHVTLPQDHVVNLLLLTEKKKRNKSVS